MFDGRLTGLPDSAVAEVTFRDCDGVSPSDDHQNRFEHFQRGSPCSLHSRDNHDTIDRWIRSSTDLAALVWHPSFGGT